MDLRLFSRVVWRFRFLVAAGLLLAIVLAFFSFVRIEVGKGSVHLQYRKSEQWTVASTLLITQRGFPWGRSLIVTDPSAVDPKTEASRLGVFADPNRFSSLAVLYAQLATSDDVRTIMRRQGPLRGKIDAQPVLSSNSSNAYVLPLIQISSIARTPLASIRLAQRATSAFEKYLTGQQEANHISAADRVVVSVLKQPRLPTLLVPRKKTLPVVVFLTVLLATIGLAFVLENLRPRVHAVEPGAGEERDAAPLARRTA